MSPPGDLEPKILLYYFMVEKQHLHPETTSVSLFVWMVAAAVNGDTTGIDQHFSNHHACVILLILFNTCLPLRVSQILWMLLDMFKASDNEYMRNIIRHINERRRVSHTVKKYIKHTLSKQACAT